MASRRSFIKTTGTGTLVFSFLPALAQVNNLFDTWLPVSIPRASPESQGISSKAILDFIKAINVSGINWHSFLLIRHGKVVAEGWWKPFDAKYTHSLYSLSKSFTSTAIGLLVKDGKLKVDDPVISFFQDELPADISDNLKKMQVKHLLTMNTGHGNDTMPKLKIANDQTWTKTFLEQPVTFEPGSHFLYNTGATYMLGAIVYKIAGQTLEEFLTPRLFQPLGIAEHDWEMSPQRLNTAGYGLRLKTEDIAKLGQLYLQKGRWNGKVILTESWVDEATKYQTKSQEGNGDWSQGYGYQFWRCKPGFFRGDGAFGQFCIVMPEQDAVLAITSESWDMQKSMTTAWENILPAMQQGSLAENQAEFMAMKKELNSLILSVPKGIPISAQASLYNGKKFKLNTNEFGAVEIQFKYSTEGCTMITTTQKGTTNIQFGWENWITSKDTLSYPYPIEGRLHMPSKIAGTATWMNERTMQLTTRFVEAIHGDKITCLFEEGKLSISFMNTISEHTKNNPETRMNLLGVLS